MPSSLFSPTIQRPQQLQITLRDDDGNVVAVATHRGMSWAVEVFLYPGRTVFTVSTYLSEAKMTEVLQALVLGYRELERQP